MWESYLDSEKFIVFGTSRSFLTGFTLLEFRDFLSQMKIKLFTELHYWQQMIGLRTKGIKI